MNRAKTYDEHEAAYDFRCEGCESEGELKIPAQPNFDFNCPEGCGARYIQFLGLSGNWELMCVVKPVFA